MSIDLLSFPLALLLHIFAAKTMERKNMREEIFNDYDGFVAKFTPKKTTDDCFTPAPIYEAVKEWVDDNIISLEGKKVVRPFWPGGDYENFDYPEGCIVIDNPPFSIHSKIRRFYHSRDIKYFLFAPALTLANSARELDATYIVCGDSLTYDNGARIATSFITNLDCGDVRVWVAGSLSKKIAAADEETRRSQSKELPVYCYPDCVASPSILHKISKRGIDFKIGKNDCFPINTLDSMRSKKSSIYGGGWLLSERAAAERAAAERAAAERAAAERAAAERAAAGKITYWTLSDREKEIISRLGK